MAPGNDLYRVCEIKKVSKRLSNDQCIAPKDIASLQKTLPVAFKKPNTTEQCRNGRRTNSAHIKSYRSKTANLQYQSFLQQLPHTFLAFILVTKERVVCDVNISRLIRQLKDAYPPFLGSDAEEALRAIARENHFDKNSDFVEWMEILFPAPIISTVGYEFKFSDIRALQLTFGDNLCPRILQSPRRTKEQAGYITECVRCVMQENVFEDIVVWLDIALDPDFLENLFPDYTNRLSADGASDNNVVLSPAATSHFSSIFTPTALLNGLHESRLREWEKKGRIGDITAGVQLHICRNDLSSGTLRLRLSQNWYHELNQLSPELKH